MTYIQLQCTETTLWLLIKIYCLRDDSFLNFCDHYFEGDQICLIDIASGQNSSNTNANVELQVDFNTGRNRIKIQYQSFKLTAV